MPKHDWVAYWGRYDDYNELERKSFNMDDTLHDIESEFSIKLMSGDQMMIIDALEERLKELAKSGKRKSAPSMQISLFD